MQTESTGRGEPDRTLALLWRDHLEAPALTRGPKQRSSVEEVVATAIILADEEGLAGVSMRKIADRLGMKPMSIYTYVPGKAELIDLMIDQVSAELPLPALEGDLRDRLERIARRQWEEYRLHPWLLDVDTSRPPLGPHVSDHWEWCLRAIDGFGLSDLDMDQTITLVIGVVATPARAFANAERLHREARESDVEWWESNSPILEQVMDASRYEVSGRVGQAAGEAYQSAHDPIRNFEFGLARVLDGIERYVGRVAAAE